jgi:hypothetical protein
MWGTLDKSESPLGRGAGLEAEERKHAVDVDEQQRTAYSHA